MRQNKETKLNLIILSWTILHVPTDVTSQRESNTMIAKYVHISH